MQPKKQLKVQYIGIRVFLLSKNALLKRGPKNLGMGRSPPPYSGNARKKTFFFQLMSSLIFTPNGRAPVLLSQMGISYLQCQ